MGDTGRFVFNSDGLATSHYSPFLTDRESDRLWAHVAEAWFGKPYDIRWRIWLLTRCARHCRGLAGSYAEFGVYRGGCAHMVLGTAGLERDRRMFLFDTFSGIPADRLTSRERDQGFAGEWSLTSADYVRGFLKQWHKQIVVVEGDVFDTLPHTETGSLAFCHLDLNASAPTRLAIEYVYPRLTVGGMILLDDYGFAGYEDQRAELDAFFSSKREEIIALPTGQALVSRLP